MFRARVFFLLCVLAATAFGEPQSKSKLHLSSALVLERAGQFAEADAEYKTAIELAGRGTDINDLVRALDASCAFYQDTGRMAQAESCLRRLYTTFAEQLGPEHLRLNRIANRLACLYIELGQRGKAERMNIPQWLARLEAEEPDSSDLIDIMGTAASIEILRGRPSRSAELNESAWALLVKRGNTASTAGMTVLNNLAIAHMEMKRNEDAVADLQKALTIGGEAGFRQTLPMAATHANLSRAYQQMKMTEPAFRHMSLALEIVELRCGKDSTRAAAILASYAPLLRKLGRKGEARMAETRAKRIGENSGIASFAAHTIDVGDLMRKR